MSKLFVNAVNCENDSCPPIWVMRQAGRYHSHYQNIRKKYSFIEICKNPEIAAEVAMGPIDDFDFDAAILFSDILFPLEAMGLKLDFNPGPVLSNYLLERSDLKHISMPSHADDFFEFQKIALDKTRERLPDEKGLITFIGGPFTLFYFAAAGKRREFADNVLSGLKDGRFEGFMDIALEVMKKNIHVQLQSDVDTIAILDTSSGLMNIDEYRDIYLPTLNKLFSYIKSIKPNLPITYYGKGIGKNHYDLLAGTEVSCFGVDHGNDIKDYLGKYQGKAIQGNLAPEILTMEEAEARKKIDEYLNDLMSLEKEKLKGWICGLGHGITPAAKEENLKYFVQTLRHKYMEKHA
jgi:uroporphyrinogen decarboxylase